MSSPSGRRFLSLPAVEPLGTASPAPLLRTLLAISREISAFHPAQFPVHRAPARDAIRLVRLLLPSLEYLPASPAAAPALLELYIASQKLRLLLHDLSRRGTGLLSLLQSERVARQFHAFSRTFALGLDVLPLMNDDTAEAVRLTARQAQRDRNFSDPADERAIEIARSALDDFRNGVRPDRVAIRNLLKHLGIHNWSSCDDEVSFLQEELKLSNSSGGGQDTALLISLLAFALYSRSVCCEAPELLKRAGVSAGAPGLNNPRVSAFDCLDADEFRCPISLDLMTDPVTVSTGQTYDRPSIVRWLKAGKLNCPVTGERLAHSDLIPNLSLGSVIRRYCLSKNISLPDPLTSRSADKEGFRSLPENPTASRALRMLAAFLVERIRDGHDDERRRAVYESWLFARSGTYHRAQLVDAGAAPWLLHFLGSWDPQVQENAMAALLNLAKHPDGRRAIVGSSGLVPILDVLGGGATAGARYNAAAVLFYLSSVDEYRVAIGETPGAVAALVGMLGSVARRGKRHAAAALLGLVGHAGNLRRVVDAGAVPVLAGIVSAAEREDVVLDVLAVLAAVAKGEDGAAEVLRSREAVRAMVEVLRSSTSQAAKEWCLSILLCLCNHGGRSAVGCLDGLPALMPSLYSQLTEGSQRASKKASSLIGILHRSSDVRDRPAVALRSEEATVRLR